MQVRKGDLIIDPTDVNGRKRLHCSLLQELPWYYVIRDRRLATQQHGQQEMIKTLVRYHIDDANKLLLPKDRAEELAVHKHPLRAISDHIASLTEKDAAALYGRLTGAQLGAVTDAV